MEKYFVADHEWLDSFELIIYDVLQFVGHRQITEFFAFVRLILNEMLHKFTFRIEIGIYVFVIFFFTLTFSLRPFLFTIAVRFLEMMIVRFLH